MADFHVSLTGSNSNPGTIEDPWLTPQYGVDHISPADRLFIRGGTYTVTPTLGAGDGGTYYCGIYVSGKNGTSENQYQVYNFPGEVVILDCIGLSGTSYARAGILLNNCSYWHITGIEIKRALQSESPRHGGVGLQIYGGNHNLIENCISHHNGGPGFQTRVPSGDELQFLNCDAYSNYDPYSDTPGDDADGFDIGFGRYGGGDYIIRLTGCRAWNNSDDGFDLYQYAGYSGKYYMVNCWAWRNGYDDIGNPAGDGNGFKLGLDNHTYDGVTRRYLYGCIAVINRTRGFSQESARVKKEFYNCIGYDNQSWDFSFGWVGDSSGFEVADILRNCIARTGQVENLHGGTFYATRISDHNSWDLPVSVTDNDFINVDFDELEYPRGLDGSLPVINAYKLTSGSDLIWKGILISGYTKDTYNNTWHNPPSLGPFETVITSTPILVSSITVSGTGSATTIIVDKGTLQMIATVLPSNADNRNVIWSVENGTGSATISTTGLLTAITDGIVTVRATATDGSNIYGTIVITLSNQVIPVTGVLVTGFGGSNRIDSFGGTLQMIATIVPANATVQSVNWSVNRSPIASIDSSGLLTALANGTVTVRSTTTEISGVYGILSVIISNQNNYITDITVSGLNGVNTISGLLNTLQMTAEISPSDADDPTFTWEVINGTGSASIDVDGLLTPITAGTVLARATANDLGGVYGEQTIVIYSAPEETEVKDICPPGWHLPSKTEIDELVVALGGYTYGGKLKQIGTVYWNPPNTEATNELNFNAIGSGQRNSVINGFEEFLNKFLAWTSTEDLSDPTSAIHWYLSHDDGLISPTPSHYESDPKTYGKSVRLVKDSTELLEGEMSTMIDVDNNVYPTICIGGKEYMASNLKVRHYNDGSPIPIITDQDEWDNLTTGAMCFYDNIDPLDV